MMNSIIILNFETGEVHVFSYDENIWESAEEFVNSEENAEYGFTENNSHYMVTKNLEIKIH